MFLHATIPRIPQLSIFLIVKPAIRALPTSIAESTHLFAGASCRKAETRLNESSYASSS